MFDPGSTLVACAIFPVRGKFSFARRRLLAGSLVMTPLEDQPAERLRTPPAERFAGPVHLFSLQHVLDDLRAEGHPARSGHRQMTLFHRGPVTQVLFAFEAGGHLAKHSASGLVSIHVLEGHLTVEADDAQHDLTAGQILILDPDLPHDVRAAEASAMLLTVHLEKGK